MTGTDRNTVKRETTPADCSGAGVERAGVRASACFIDRFSSLDDLSGKDRRDPHAILAVLAKTGRFSCFEIDQRMAKPMTWLLNQSGWVKTRNQEVVRDPDGFGSTTRDTYPWTYCEVTSLGKLVLAGLCPTLTPTGGSDE